MNEMTIEVPDLGLVAETSPPVEHEIPLAVRRTRRTTEKPRTVMSTVLLGGPDCARMKPRDGEDPHLADRREDADFWSVLMSLTVSPGEGETLTSAWLKVDLSAPDGSPPIAFAMQPSREEAGVELQAGAGADVDVKVAKLSGSVQRTYTLHEAEILAERRLRPDPGWTITPSSGRPIRGGADFVVVVKAPRGTRGSGQVSFGAEIEWVETGFLKRQRREVSWAGDPATFALD
jgi:hypothetical protein